MRRNYLRRAIGIAVAFAPLGLLVASLGTALRRGDERHLSGLAIALVAVAIAGLNFYLSAIRGRIYGSKQGYRHISGFPLAGTVVTVVATVVGFGSILVTALGALAVAIDTGGSAWFVVATWNDASLWDR